MERPWVHWGGKEGEEAGQDYFTPPPLQTTAAAYILNPTERDTQRLAKWHIWAPLEVLEPPTGLGNQSFHC